MSNRREYLGFLATGLSVAVGGCLDGGRGCVEPSLNAAASGEYPLARPLFTYVNTDLLGEAHIAPFARYFVEQSANEDLLADELGYVPTRKRGWKRSWTN